MENLKSGYGGPYPKHLTPASMEKPDYIRLADDMLGCTSLDLFVELLGYIRSKMEDRLASEISQVEADHAVLSDRSAMLKKSFSIVSKS